MRLKHSSWQLADDITKGIVLKQIFGILVEISLKFVHKGPIDDISALI